MDLDRIISFVKNPEISKFLLVGFVGAGTTLVLTIVFSEFFGIFYLISAAIGFEISIIWGFFANDKWTFSKVKKTSKSYVRFIKYNSFSLMKLGIIVIIMFVLTTYGGLHYTISQSIAIVVAFFFDFTVSKMISFKN